MQRGYNIRLTQGWDDLGTYTVCAPSDRLCAWSFGLELCTKGAGECEHWVDWATHVHIPQNISAIQNLRPEIRALLERAASLQMGVLYLRETTVI